LAAGHINQVTAGAANGAFHHMKNTHDSGIRARSVDRIKGAWRTRWP
jgi:hypothetical protein